MQEACQSCRKIGTKLFIKGERCLSPKCALTRRTAGQNPKSGGRRRKKSEYGLQLQEKQNAKAEYGLREKQFKRYFEFASKAKEATGEALLQNLERRLDNVIYRLGWTQSRNQARQIVNHGHIKVNGKVLDIPSYQVRLEDQIEGANVTLLGNTSVEKPTIPSWLKTEKGNFKAKVTNFPAREEIDTPVDEQLIVEFYSR